LFQIAKLRQYFYQSKSSDATIQLSVTAQHAQLVHLLKFQFQVQVLHLKTLP